MPSRIVPFVNGEFYHVFNRGVAKMPIFHTARDHKRFLETMIYYQLEGPKPRFSLFNPETTSLDENQKIVDIIAYCFMPNHFHLLLKQIRDGGITEFVSKLSNSFTKYFNTKNNRQGPLLQGEFKSAYVQYDEYLIHLSRYIHLNPLVNFITKDLESYEWSSYHEYVKPRRGSICNMQPVLSHFSSAKDYKNFVLEHENYAKELEAIKHLTLDLDD